MWVCLKIGYIPNYSHLIGIMISKTIGFRGTLFSDIPMCVVDFTCWLSPQLLLRPINRTAAGHRVPRLRSGRNGPGWCVGVARASRRGAGGETMGIHGSLSTLIFI